MAFIEPMYAAPMPAVVPDFTEQDWVAEEKYDGHRLVVQVYVGQPLAWSRYGLVRVLPDHLMKALGYLPDGVYDGELFVPGKRSYGVTEIVNGPDLVFTMFDVPELLHTDMTKQTYQNRRSHLKEALVRSGLGDSPHVVLAPSTPILTAKQMHAVVETIWARDGEGIILKRALSYYSPGKRPKLDWIKIKALRSAVLTVVGFRESGGQKVNRGPFAMVILEDIEGHLITVKTRNDAELDRFQQEWKKRTGTQHPALGRKLRIEYQERTPDGSYRHPRWDRWEDE
jgi:bifunctional non-homologous end joining protein LigD